jgi:hypothetical protein
MTSLHYSDSILVSRPPEELYDMVADVTRTGEWSPICRSCWWDEGESARVGAWFTGRNETADRTWETRSQVVVAERGREFAFIVGGSFVRWAYTFAATDSGTVMTETWDFLPGGVALFHERYGKDAQAEMDDRSRAAHQGIPITLAALKQAAETATAPRE